MITRHSALTGALAMAALLSQTKQNCASLQSCR